MHVPLDGNLDRTELKCASTEAEAGAWWLVDLGEFHSIEAVTITTPHGENNMLSQISEQI